MQFVENSDALSVNARDVKKTTIRFPSYSVPNRNWRLSSCGNEENYYLIEKKKNRFSLEKLKITRLINFEFKEEFLGNNFRYFSICIYSFHTLDVYNNKFVMFVLLKGNFTSIDFKRQFSIIVNQK